MAIDMYREEETDNRMNIASRNKGFINIIEMITTVVIVFVAFAIFFPGYNYQNRWNDAYLTITARDSILTMDRLGSLYDFSFYPDGLQSYLNTVIPTNQTNLIAWSEVDGTVKNTVTIYCNCTDSQITTLEAWLNELTFNNRSVSFYVLKTNLDTLGQTSSLPANQQPDVLLIWGYNNLSAYAPQLQSFIKQERGVVEMMDFNSVGSVNNDLAQQKIFGLNAVSIDTAQQTSDNFVRNPTNDTDILYGLYKYFYHLPIPVVNIPNQTAAILNSTVVNNCNSFGEGNLTVNATVYKFWNCGTSVYFDVNGNGKADVLIFPQSYFDLNSTVLYLNYVDPMFVGASIQPPFTFKDFANFGSNQISKIVPLADGADPHLDKVAIATNPGGYSAVILNQSSISRAAWIPDFTANMNVYGDDDKMLLTSLLLWASNKRISNVLPSVGNVGFVTSYINTANLDMFEVYTFNLGLGSPFGR